MFIKMKKLLYVVAILAFIGACKKNGNGSFEVTGEIKNAPGKKLLLIETPYASTQSVILDSVFLDDNGKFKLKGMATEEGIYRLAIENGPDLVLINDNDHIEVELDVNDYRNYKVEGSPATKSLHDLFEKYRSQDSGILSTFKQVDSLQGVPGNDSLVETLKTRNDNQIETLNNTVRSFINQSESPAATFYAIGIASQTIPNEELKKLVDNAASKFPEHNGLARIKSLLAVQTDQSGGTAEYALLNQQAPGLVMKDPNGNNVSLESFKGKYVLVDFWASWCMPCRQENPNVVEAYNKFKDKNFTILGVSLDQNKEAWISAIQKDNLNWAHMSDLKQWESEAVQKYNIEGIPFNVLLDPQGKIIASSLRGQELHTKLAQVLN